MHIDNEIVLEGLKYYGISDQSYEDKCLECVDYIFKHDNLMVKINNLIDILYNKKDYDLAKFWKLNKMEELFGNDYHPYVTNIIVLLGYKLHKENMKKYNLDDKQVFIHKKRAREALTYDVYKRGYDGIRISQMLWASYFINLRILEVGVLQYELVNFNPITKEKETCIKIHIPKNTLLDINKVRKSIEQSKLEIKKYFGIKDVNYYCESWLLSKEVLCLLSDNSNILKFSNLFYIASGGDCKKDILNFVFNKIGQVKYETLSDDTSLQRNLKKLLLNGDIIRIGIGKLKEDIK